MTSGERDSPRSSRRLRAKLVHSRENMYLFISLVVGSGAAGTLCTYNLTFMTLPNDGQITDGG